MFEMDPLTAGAAVLMGISLAACAGLRAFLPLLAIGVAVRMEWLPVQEWFRWAGSDEALIIFGVATVLEVLADKVPFLDHVLDLFYTVARPVAGALVAMSAFYQVSPAHATVLGIIVGAPVAGGLHLARASTRVVSTHTTAGLGNPVLSLAEDVLAIFGTVLAFVAPILTFVGLVTVTVLGLRWLRKRKGRVAPSV